MNEHEAVREAVVALAYGEATEAEVASVLNAAAVSEDLTVRAYAFRCDVPKPWGGTDSYAAFAALVGLEGFPDESPCERGRRLLAEGVRRESLWYAGHGRRVAEALSKALWVAKDVWPTYEDSVTRFAWEVTTADPNDERWRGKLPLATNLLREGPLRGWYEARAYGATAFSFSVPTRLVWVSPSAGLRLGGNEAVEGDTLYSAEAFQALSGIIEYARRRL